MRSAYTGTRGDQSAPETAAVFDRPHLARYTMDNPELEREIISLFLEQLPSVIAMLKDAETQSAWKLAAHTLKGSAAAVGATAIHSCAVELEGYMFDLDARVKNGLLAELELRTGHFRDLMTKIYR